jgi:hypothetical protein
MATASIVEYDADNGRFWLRLSTQPC